MEQKQSETEKIYQKMPFIVAASFLTIGCLCIAIHSFSSSSETSEKSMELTTEEITETSEQLLIPATEQDSSNVNLGSVPEMETVPEIIAATEQETEHDPLNPQFSVPAGFYSGEVRLTLTSDTGTAIYYTTDGSTPTTESILYTLPIQIISRAGEANYIASRSDTSVNPVVITDPVDKATVIRAIAIAPDGTESDVITHTYFVGLDQERNYHNINIVSISADESSLFDYNTGIYCTGAVYDNYGRYSDSFFIPANYTQSGRDWEREVGVEIFDTEGNSIASQEMGLRIIGGTSRASVQKSLKLYAREEYGKKNLHCALLPDLYKEYDPSDDIKKFKTFVLRNGGDDHYGTKFRDAFIQRLIADRAVSTQHAQPAIGFLNGEYSGIYNLQEDYSDYYIQSHFGVSKEDVIMIKTEEIEEGTDEDYYEYLAFSEYVNSADFSDNDVYAEYCQKMDIQSLIDYFSFEIWIENNDWIDVGNNYRLWKSRSVTDQPFQDGKWRWAAYDTEYWDVTETASLSAVHSC